MKSAFEQIAEESKFPELDTPEKLEDWVRTMDLRVRTMCRHVCQSKSQSPTPKWMAHLELPADSADGVGDAAAGSEEVQGAMPEDGVIPQEGQGEAPAEPAVPDAAESAEQALRRYMIYPKPPTRVTPWFHCCQKAYLMKG